MGIEYTLGKFADDTRLGGSVNLLKGRKALQRHLDRFNQLTKDECKIFSKIKCWILHLCGTNSRHSYRLGHESWSEEKDLGSI